MIKYICLLFLAGAALSRCNTHKKVEYNIASHVAPENRALFIERAEKGRILFREHCSGCHGVFARGKDGVPDFTHRQIENYKARDIAQRGSHTTTRQLSGQQLDYILDFLRLRVVKDPVQTPDHPHAGPGQ
jgi:hypothetical protein